MNWELSDCEILDRYLELDLYSKLAYQEQTDPAYAWASEIDMLELLYGFEDEYMYW